MVGGATWKGDGEKWMRNILRLSMLLIECQRILPKNVFCAVWDAFEPFARWPQENFRSLVDGTESASAVFTLLEDFEGLAGLLGVLDMRSRLRRKWKVSVKVEH